MSDAVSPEFLALQQAVAGRYSLERELGRGGMGVVFLARDVALDRPVAVKLLLPEVAARPGARERFLNEARTAAKLSQPNIVAIHAVEELGDLVFFVMAYIEGETLGDRLRSRGPLTPHEAARLLQEVAWALAYAHGRGVVHRDVKPDNILLERGTGRALVMDFGIAAARGASGEVLGTAQYISPEQANGDPVDGRSDLYSLGVVGFLVLAGRLPFEADDSAGLIAMHLTRPAPPLATVAAGMPGRLAAAVDRCLVKRAEDRFPTGEAWAEAVSQSVEPRRELPVPVRLWLTKGQSHPLTFAVWYGFAGPSVGMMIGGLTYSLTNSEPLAWALGIAAYVVTPLKFAFLSRWWRLRVLLGQGYSADDVRIAVRERAERRREELSFEFGGKPPAWARVMRLVMIGGTSAFVASVAGLFLSRGEEVMTFITLGTGLAAIAGLLAHRIHPGRRVTKDTPAEWRVRFWNSPVARWFEKLARFGLRRRAVPTELTYRPTELAIGLAADALYDALPKEQRKELKELPPLVERLQRDAQLMRQTVDELNAALAGLGDSGAAARSHALRDGAAAEPAAAVGDVREKLRRDLAARRDEAAARLGAAVAALESIRLNLLRLKAGTGTVGELTADLATAREAQREMELAVEARHEVETLLGGVSAITGELRRTGEQRLSGPAHG